MRTRSAKASHVLRLHIESSDTNLPLTSETRPRASVTFPDKVLVGIRLCRFVQIFAAWVLHRPGCRTVTMLLSPL